MINEDRPRITTKTEEGKAIDLIMLPITLPRLKRLKEIDKMEPDKEIGEWSRIFEYMKCYTGLSDDILNSIEIIELKKAFNIFVKETSRPFQESQEEKNEESKN